MKKYGITILCHDTDGTTYIDTITQLFNTKEEAQEQINKSITDELENLGENYFKRENQILLATENDFCMEISEYQIWEFEDKDEEENHLTATRECSYDFDTDENGEPYECITIDGKTYIELDYINKKGETKC